MLRAVRCNVDATPARDLGHAPTGTPSFGFMLHGRIDEQAQIRALVDSAALIRHVESRVRADITAAARG
ncbi:hypothetical protein [Nocardia sp. Marseille-Q1738]